MFKYVNVDPFGSSIVLSVGEKIGNHATVSLYRTGFCFCLASTLKWNFIAPCFDLLNVMI